MAEITQIDAEFSLSRIQAYTWILLAAMTAAGWLTFSLHIALSILIGGIVANLSFALLKKDLTALLGGPLKVVKIRFFIKYYARFTLLAVILYVLIKHQDVHTMGLLAGLSTVVLSVMIAVASEAKRIFFKAKEAS